MNDQQQFRVRFTGYYWSGYSISAMLDKLPEIGESICAHVYADPPIPNAIPRIVQAIKQNRICSHCGSQTPEGDSLEYVIYVEREEDLHPCVTSYYAAEFPPA